MAHTHRELVEPEVSSGGGRELVAQPPEPAKEWASLFGIVRPGREHHEAAESDGFERHGGVDDAADFRFRRAMFRGLTGKVDLDEDVERTVKVGGHPVEPAQQGDAVD